MKLLYIYATDKNTKTALKVEEIEAACKVKEYDCVLKTKQNKEEIEAACKVKE